MEVQASVLPEGVHIRGHPSPETPQRPGLLEDVHVEASQPEASGDVYSSYVRRARGRALQIFGEQFLPLCFFESLVFTFLFVCVCVPSSAGIIILF